MYDSVTKKNVTIFVEAALNINLWLTNFLEYSFVLSPAGMMMTNVACVPTSRIHHSELVRILSAVSGQIEQESINS